MDTRTEPEAPIASGGFERLVALIGGAIMIIVGAWAFFAPRSFFDTLAVFEPYNRHFIHDLGAFQIGLGAVLLLGVYLRDALVVALFGVGIGAFVHALSHVLDRNLGGNPAFDIPALFVLAIALLVGAIKRRARTT